MPMLCEPSSSSTVARQFDPQVCDALLSSGRFNELFKYSSHQSLPHTGEIPRLRLAVNP